MIWARAGTLRSAWSLPGSRSRPHYAWLFFIAVAAVLPSLIWIALDRTVWPWDQAWYGTHSVELFFTLIDSPSRWPGAMLNILGRQAPGIVWFGQFFVPVGLAIGSIDTGLLLSIVVAQLLALFLTSVAVWELAERRFPLAVVAVAAMASAPLFIGLSHYYLVEMMQTAAVAWFVLIMALAPRWSRWLTASQLLLAASFAMLAKVSSPLYCVGPGLVALYYMVRSGTKDQVNQRTALAATLAPAVVLGAATAAWYYLNLDTVFAHVSLATSGSVAELYGMKANFLENVNYWIVAFQTNFFSPTAAMVAAGTLLASVAVSLVTRQDRTGRFALAVSVSALEIAVVLCVFSLNSNRDNRYLLPVLPYAVLIVSWSINRLDSRLVTYGVIAAFGLQWSDVHARALGPTDGVSGTPDWVNARVSDASKRTLLRALVERTCVEPASERYWNAVGVQLLWLNPPALSYAAAKALAPRHTLNCDFDAIGYYDNNENQAWSNLLSRKIAYYVAVDPTVYPTPSTKVDLTANQLNAPILKRIESSGLFRLEPGIEGHRGILIFKRVGAIASVAHGRMLSDEGQHQQAIDELRKACAQESTNIEAWANLALAFERDGDFLQAVVAGNRARALNASHYYVNLGLARASMQLKDWTTAIERAQDAAVNAPGVPERIDALAVSAQASFQAEDSANGCGLLRRAAELQTRLDILDELARNGCGR